MAGFVVSLSEMYRKRLCLVIVTTATALMAMRSANAVNPELEKAWIEIKPVQCLGNPWEKWWQAGHRNFPRSQEQRIIRGYFKKRDITIRGIRVRPYRKGEALCSSCDCPRGDTLFLLVDGSDVAKMYQMGYKDRIPADETISNTQ